MNDKLKEIAVYDGLVLRQPKNSNYEAYYQRFDSDGLIRAEYPLKQLNKYLTSLDWLHPVAMKVLGELRNVYTIIGASKHLVSISVACAQPPINGEYSDLFNATYDAIVYLKNQSK